MKQHSHIWQTWAKTLEHWGVKDIIATLLEALGPLNLFGAQLVYVGQPFLNPFVSEGYLEELANLLENPRETQAFIAVLRQSDQPTITNSMEEKKQ